MRISSIMVTLRALVMLVSLVVVPLWAVMGTTWPAKIITFFGGQARSESEARAESIPHHGELTEAPAYHGPAAASMPAASPQSAMNEQRGAVILPPQPVPSSSGNNPGNGGFSGQNPLPRDPRAVQNLQTSYEEPAANPNHPVAVLGPSNDPRDQFKGLERRLRELGARYYRLETWGDSGELYRFHCQMPQSEGPQDRLFEATDRDAFQAMARVVHDVEGWRNSRMR